MAELFVALLHYPVYNKHGHVVTTAITSLDVPDIARSCRSFGVRAFYVVTPVDGLRGLTRKILRHWREGFGASYNPQRRDALALVELERSLEGVEINIEAATGQLPVTIATSARRLAGAVDFASLRREIEHSSLPHLLLLGTGWGLADAVVGRAARILEPIGGRGSYNHLSVRAAAAIMLDRLVGSR